MSVLRIKDKNGKWVGITTIQGEPGKGFDNLTPEDIGAASIEDVRAIEKSKAPLNHASQHSTDGTDPITPADIGAVSKTGDTINGNLNVNGAFMVERSDNNRKARTVVHNNDAKEADLQNYTDDNNYVGIRIATETMGAGDAAKLVHMKNGQFASFPILHTGNKEKIFTFGAEDLTAGSSPLGNGQLHFVYE